MTLDDTVGQREPETGALANRFGREKGLEYPHQMLRLDALAGIGNLDPDPAVFLGRTDLDGPLPLDGLGRVLEESGRPIDPAGHTVTRESVRIPESTDYRLSVHARRRPA